ncbi:MAG TPA: LysE family translocator [Dongiaceae bacterium]|nr:LysE family translocator [Dongiaceae bacterium]
MPEFHTIGAFIAAALLLLVMPGPTDTLVVSYVLTRGRRSALASVPGVCLGYIASLSLTLLGLGALLMTSAELFNALKIAGALYLIYLGIKTWRAPVPETLEDGNRLARDRWRMFTQAFVVTALNPAGIMFYVAFFPQFIDVERPLLPQMVALGACFVVLGTLNSALYATLAAQVRRFIRSYRARKTINRATGGILIAMGGMMGLAKRAA